MFESFLASTNYTHTKQWDIGLSLFLADLEVLTRKGSAMKYLNQTGVSPFENLSVMIHLDHTQWDSDEPLLHWDMNRFSMIMYDASALPFEENIKKTSGFVEMNRDKIVIEGACDEIVDANGEEKSQLTTPDFLEAFLTISSKRRGELSLSRQVHILTFAIPSLKRFLI